MGYREAKRARMRKLVKEWRASAEPVGRFAKRHGMSENGFRYWRLQFAPGRLAPPIKDPVTFAPARVVDDGAPANPAALEIRLTTGDVIRTESGISIERLRSVIQLLRERC
jgi:hypothetical protein